MVADDFEFRTVLARTGGSVVGLYLDSLHSIELSRPAIRHAESALHLSAARFLAERVEFLPEIDFPEAPTAAAWIRFKRSSRARSRCRAAGLPR
jgi:hypothetical protein